ncbi:gluzincin family metallopeptidase [Chryseobacterium pennipullorum]|uniref:Aminopeptidase n=1 Tax=Chryseobacterium pennipullorum TaxID=2258963 RepID=A0A3D9B2Z0_9FLAO|nr:aminopeptidase [Chryseobacterium pennipullorum]REC47995.1 aminopeptidase [Chryseobacterium pennipullorum]
MSLYHHYLKKISICLILFWGTLQVSAQKDSIHIEAKLSADRKILEVNQKIVYYNYSDKDLNTVKLLNWVSAYNRRGTSLVYRKLEDRNNDLHFAKGDQVGKLLELNITNSENENIPLNTLADENLFLPLKKVVKPGESITLQLQYTMQLPDKRFTGYGTSGQNTALKYFFIVPDHFDPDNISPRSYNDIEESVSFNTYWTINFDIPVNHFIEGNLPQIQMNSFKGYLDSDPEFLISQTQYPSIKINNEGIDTEIKFGYTLKPEEKQNLEFYLPLHLKFLKEKTGALPGRIFISDKFRNNEDFFGNNDITFWKFRFRLFTDAEKTDLDYFGIITKKVLDQNIIADKEKDHWFKNGLKSYLEIQYLKKFYRDTKILGNLPETRIFGLKPLKLFHASKVKLLDRYGLAYQYIMLQNLDQKIGEDFSALSNFNDMAISGFETGSLFSYSAEKMGSDSFNEIVKNYVSRNSGKRTHPEDFLKDLSQKDTSTSYLTDFFKQKNRVNFRLKHIDKENDSLQIRIAKNTNASIPVKLETETREGEKKVYWIDTEEDKRMTSLSVPASDNIYKVTLNSGYIFPESSYRDNFLYAKGLFSNAKKIKFKLIKDIPNPEYNEIYVSPRVRFNNTYDKFLLGVNLKNQSLFDQKFLYSVTPTYSTGTGKLTGSGAVSYSFLPAESFIRSLTFGVSGAYFHYDYGLAYRKASIASTLSFRKDPRSTVSRSIGISYNYFERDLSAKMIANNDYSKYNLWSAGYGYSDSQMIHEKSLSLSTQGMEDFNKVTAEGFYRWEFAPRQKLSLRLFAGYFLRNDTRNNLFNYGISRVSNYAFSYSLLGESASSGLLSQQFILADGGFKSFIPGTVNQWITSMNVDSSVWKIFHVYADAGIYKNKDMPAKFIWDSGIKVRIIPDFLEVYFPIQSSLGFEPAFKDYAKRIRYTLVLNLGSIINAARRGWY